MCSPRPGAPTLEPPPPPPKIPTAQQPDQRWGAVDSLSSLVLYGPLQLWHLQSQDLQPCTSK